MFSSSGNWYEGEDDDPYSLIFVIKDRSEGLDGAVVSPAEPEAVKCALKAFEMMLDEYGKNDDVTWRLDEWTNARIRKLVKRAHGSKWHKAMNVALNGNVPARAYPDGYASVICVAPMRASEQPKAIRQLQVSGLNLELRSNCECGQHMLHIVLEEDLDMSSGKAIAQYGHAYQLAYRYLPDDQFQKWMENGAETDIRRGSLEDARAVHDCPVEVHDAGFTEIEPGSATAVAYFE